MVKNAQHETLAPGIASALKDRILSGELQPGTPLHQVALAETLGVSLIPLREALRIMEADGLVEFVAHKGVRVAEVRSEEVYEWSLEVKALVGVLLPLVVPRLDATALAELRALARRKPTTLRTLQDFFSLACAPCGMPRLLRRVEQMMTQFGRYLPSGGDVVLAGLQERPPTLEDIVRAFETGNADYVLGAFDAYLSPWVLEFRKRLDARA